MWRKLGWEEIFSEAQRGGDRQAQLELKDNIVSILRARDVPENTLEDLVLIFAYLLLRSCTQQPRTAPQLKPNKDGLLQEDTPAHDSVLAAAAELVPEEEQAAAKAAAKKAKKLRQKLKAKKEAQPEPSASAAEPHDAHTPSTEAQPLSPSTLLSMDLSKVSLSAAQHQAQSPEAHDRNHQQQQQQQLELELEHDEAEGTSLFVSSALGAAAAQEKDAKAVAVELEGLHLPSCDQAADKGHTDADFLQQLFCCPLTKATMVEPTIAADGHTYERNAIQNWVTHSRMSPVTGHPLSHTRLVSNQAARVAIASQLG